MVSSIDIAKGLASQGFQVFPLVPEGKTPAVAGFKSKASDKAEQVESLWTRLDAEGNPRVVDDYNVGVYTGRFRGMHLLVLDVDTKDGKEGEASLANLEDEHGALPETYTVRTATGGLHYYFLTSEPVRSSASRVGKDLDIRGEGGYVVGPGSTVKAGTYEVLVDADMVDAPAWLVQLAGKPKRKESGQAVAELDTGPAMDKATRYLIESAPEAIEGAGGDATTYKVACAVADFGVSLHTAVQLMLDVWNPLKAKPQWEADELERKVENAYTYRENKVGSRNPQDAFKDFINRDPSTSTSLSTPKAPSFVPQILGDFNEADIPVRQWILGKYLLEKNITVLLAEPGVGKSTLSLQWAVALATGKSEIAGATVHKKGASLIINNEDDTVEMKRRIAGIRNFFSVEDRKALDNIFFYSGVEKPFIIGGKTDKDGAISKGRHMEELIEFVRANNIKLIVADPFLETHCADENDNQQISAIARMYREVANKCDCAVLLVHHTRKRSGADSAGHAGNMDSGRGASSLVGAARIVITLYEMSKEDAEEFGIPNNERLRYIRLDDAKGNFALKSPDATWFRREGVRLVNGEESGVLKPIKLKAKEQQVLDELFEAFATWPEFDDLRTAEEMPITEVARILTDGRVFCGAKASEDGGFPSDKTVGRYLRQLVKDGEKLLHGPYAIWTSTMLHPRNQKETRLLHFKNEEE